MRGRVPHALPWPARRLPAALAAGALALFLGLAPPIGHAQNAQATDTTATDVLRLEARIEALESPEGEPATGGNADALALYREARERLQQAQRDQQAAAAFRAALENAPGRAARARREAESDRAPDDWPPLPGEGADLATLEQALSEEKARLAALQSELQALEAQLADMRDQPARLREALLELRSEQEALTQESASADGEELAEARAALLDARRRAVAAKTRMLEQQLLSHNARQELARAQRLRLLQHIEWLQQRVGSLETRVNRESRSEAERAREQAQRAAESVRGLHPLLSEQAQRNNALSEQLNTLVAGVEQLAEENRYAQRQLEQLRRSYQSTRRQLELAGGDVLLGEALLRERRSLPPPQRFEERLKALRTRLARARLEMLRLQETARALQEPKALARELVAERVRLTARPEDIPRIHTALEALLAEQAGLVDTLRLNLNRRIDRIAELAQAQERLQEQSARYAALLDEHLLWVASADPLNRAWFSQLREALLALLRAAGWRSVIQAIGQGAASRPASTTGLLLAALFCLLLTPRLRRLLREAQRRVGHPLEDRFRYSLQALAYTTLLSLPTPLLLGTLGWLATRGAGPGSFAHALGEGLQAAALIGFLGLGLSQSCRPGGLAPVHFRWPIGLCRQLRAPLRRFVPLLALSALLVAYGAEQQGTGAHDSLGRAAYMSAALLLAWTAWNWLRAGRLLPRRSAGYSWQLLRFAVTALPLALATLAGLGYYYTALQLASRLMASAWWLLLIIVGLSLILRGMRLAERRLAHLRASQRRKQGGGVIEQQPQLSLQTVDEQTRQLLRLLVGVSLLVGLWWLWADLLPALRILQEVVLWHHYTGAGSEQLMRPVTLLDAALAVALLSGVILLVRNLPGLLEILLLRRVHMDPGNRYAVTTLSRYLVTGLGLIAAIALIGIRWSEAQWLVAALGVGLGFGLQEIFANFVSGLIILFERPVRVGDTVTLGDRTGTVSRIRIRATTITDWARRELIIPNKDFVTEQLINWTLSDQITQLLIEVRVDFASEPETVSRVLREAVRTQGLILSDPAPSVHFMRFGEQGMHFEIRAYLQGMEDRLSVTDALHQSILAGLRAQGIRLAAPQRELHLRSVSARAWPPGRDGPSPTGGDQAPDLR
ncbi:mechanosensitive ion channel domain-containing protein [Alkalilimnicola sp. S0819]|uniref:mechanosensitive ion channel domain-containing protein n=1 Tax=Alkalilimnicola sp. S0819 TaxID=2613922 RepID=UPI001262A432|nr:mechanosensitive ion channel domain-containing protein [Alkalilimnicola sp. S0819]KAB7627471.1 mechanosensitive ion channel [Alkalilimnicola sp. S0819]MPQ15623.1 mechanosensitive ion channel [Alkalilimnicola sp. S0819]